MGNLFSICGLSKKEKPSPPPLKNIGEICYMNSIIQALGSCEKFRRDIKSLKKSNNYKSERLERLIRLLDALNLETAQHEFDEFIHKYGWTKKGQQDSYEMLAYFINLMYNELKSEEETREPNLIDAEVYKKWQERILPGRIKMNSTTRCGCNTNNRNIMTDFALHLPLVKEDSKDIYNLNEMIKEVIKEDSVDDCCDKCNQKQMLVVLIEGEPPTTLCLHIQANRFDFETEKMIKPDYKLDFPFQIRIENRKYELVSFVEHAGKVSGGHYEAFRKFGENWFRVNDNIVTKLDVVKEPKQYSQKPYLLFYEAL